MTLKRSPFLDTRAYIKPCIQFHFQIFSILKATRPVYCHIMIFEIQSRTKKGNTTNFTYPQNPSPCGWGGRGDQLLQVLKF